MTQYAFTKDLKFTPFPDELPRFYLCSWAWGAFTPTGASGPPLPLFAGEVGSTCDAGEGGVPDAP